MNELPMVFIRAITACVAVALVTSCGDDTNSEDSGRLEISRDTFKGTWPFIVEEGALSCDRNAVIFTAEGNAWAVNGAAAGRGFDEIDPIWRRAKGPAPRVNISDVLERGLELCE